jgi:hypothetical protein
MMYSISLNVGMPVVLSFLLNTFVIFGVQMQKQATGIGVKRTFELQMALNVIVDVV